MMAYNVGGGELLFGDPHWAREAASICGVAFSPETISSVCYVKDGELVIAALYEHIVMNVSCTMHVATSKAAYAPRDAWWSAFYLPFDGWGCKKIIGPISETNEAALSLVRRLGFKEEARLPGVYPEACVFMTLVREDSWCLNKIVPRHFEANHGRQRTGTT